MPVVPDHGRTTQAAFKAARLGVTDIWIAPYNTAYNAVGGSKNLSWRYAGRLIPGSYKNDLSKTFFDNMTGTPATLKERFVIEVQGKIEFSLMEFTGLAYELANGGQAGRAMFRAVPIATTTTAVAPAVDTFQLTSITGFAVGDEIEVALGGAVGMQYTYITNIAVAVIDVWPKLSQAPVATNAVKLVDGWELAAGGSVITYYAFRAVHYTTDDTAMLTWAPKVSAEGIKDDYADGKKIFECPLSLACHGFTDANFTGPIVAKKFILNNTLLTALNLYT